MVHVENLTVKYNKNDEHFAIENISFHVPPGEKLALIGANGAGKSTVLLSLIGVIKAVTGKIVISDIQVKEENFRALRQKVGMVFQNPDDQLFMPTIEDDIAFGLRNYGFDEKTISERTDAISERLGISHLKKRMSGKLSGGEKRLAALAGVLVMQPSVLLMDEPSSFLDPRSRRILISLLSGFEESMIIATHDFELASALCPKALFLKQGKVFVEGDTKELLSDTELLENSGL